MCCIVKIFLVSTEQAVIVYITPFSQLCEKRIYIYIQEDASYQNAG